MSSFRLKFGNIDLYIHEDFSTNQIYYFLHKLHIFYKKEQKKTARGYLAAYVKP
ncbi:hypothetical protein B23_0494 [Geobacillus thermoleovorans B23]|nr:hypothetical protein B23_0494 [Geobacillus thermoleovorans B23]